MAGAWCSRCSAHRTAAGVSQAWIKTPMSCCSSLTISGPITNQRSAQGSTTRLPIPPMLFRYHIIVEYMASSAFAMCLWVGIPTPVLLFPKSLACIAQGVVIIGHSTGCQDAVRYVARHTKAADAAQLLGIILQAPVTSLSPLSVWCNWCIRLLEGRVMLTILMFTGE